ncbi:tyrosine-type recombinase/integrase [Limosilactobacillus mucosae]|jgi:integrase|uniref:tyrosine-type recombinase/integrase n=1 Tax=Limosilactobacillus mucosae TaxID=97478 RepID=UPI0015D56A44|nr:site-specific integrase [Limosilactobacillus mucosae]QLI95187.1 site-specific integrase [Limosilactobacillus mucosae]
MWTEPTKTGKVKFVEQFKNPLTLKYMRVSITMDKETNTTRKLAQQTLNKRIEEKLRHLEDGQIKEGVTFGELIEEFDNYYQQTVKPSTFASWKRLKACILKNFDSNILVSKITNKYLTNTLEAMIYQRGYNNAYVSQIKSKINQLMRHAYRHDYTAAPIGQLEINWKRNNSAKSIEDKYLDDDEVKQVLEAVRAINPVHADVLMWQYLTGMRIGEVLALQVKNVFLENGKWFVKIDCTLEYSYKRKSEFTISNTPKTQSSNRTILLPDKAVKIYRQYSLNKQPDDVLFSIETKTGAFLHPLSMDNQLKKIQKALDLPKPLSTHIFRHTHASKLAELGVPIELISKRLGHKDSAITRQIYLHVTKKTAERYSGLINSFDV